MERPPDRLWRADSFVSTLATHLTSKTFFFSSSYTHVQSRTRRRLMQFQQSELKGKCGRPPQCTVGGGKFDETSQCPVKHSVLTVCCAKYSWRRHTKGALDWEGLLAEPAERNQTACCSCTIYVRPRLQGGISFWFGRRSKTMQHRGVALWRISPAVCHIFSTSQKFGHTL